MAQHQPPPAEGDPDQKKQRTAMSLGPAEAEVTTPTKLTAKAAGSPASSEASPGSTAAGGAEQSESTRRRRALDLPDSISLRPEKPSNELIEAGQACTVRAYMKRLEPYVRARLSIFLSKRAGIMPKTPSYAQVSPKNHRR